MADAQGAITHLASNGKLVTELRFARPKLPKNLRERSGLNAACMQGPCLNNVLGYLIS